MSRWLKNTLLIGAAVLVSMQFIRPARYNPPIDHTQTLQAHLSEQSPAVSVVNRACRDCHTNETTWPWYSNVAPVSWLIVHDVEEGREAVNFSTWGAYPSDQQQKLLKEACEEVSQGEMPMSFYTVLHPEARLSAADVHAMCGSTQVTKVEE